MSSLRRRTLLALALVTAVPGARAEELFQGVLSGAAVNPPNASPGVGAVGMDYDSVLHTLAVELAFSGLLGPTTASHIHCCVTPPTNIGVALPFAGFPLSVTAGNYGQQFDLTNPSVYQASFLTASGGSAALAEAALLTGMRAGRAYVVVHTTMFPGGEIRAFLLPVVVFLDGFESEDTTAWSLTVP